ncbi:hypothetical protein DFH07DRAFT_1055921 [Mycena maculata]|uniref:Uncharacterized protein n=1 Tax=Mycena maculata TaxID=230809 RepID=A0AAD7K873_9AGAR|nr:hypothetical protein DFH07DRAFT_1055921 [Mycena maculata]
MVAVNPRFTLLALSLASLSLTPSADAAAINARPSAPGSPSKGARQPMPMKLAAKQQGNDDMSKKSRFHKSRAVGVPAPLVKRQQGQARFDMSRATRSHVGSEITTGDPRFHKSVRRDDPPQAPCNQTGVVSITSPNGSPNSTTNSTTMGHLVLNCSPTPYVLDASEKNSTTFTMVPYGNNTNTVVLQVPIDGCVSQNTTSPRTDAGPYCATYNPNPPQPEPLTVQKCNTATSSQQFYYDPTTGVVQPMWYTSPGNGTADAASAVNDQEVNDSDDSDSDDESITSRDAPSPRNVTLVFVPNKPVASDDEEKDASDPMSSSATETDTVTTTVTASPTPSFVAAEVDSHSSTTDAPSSTPFPTGVVSSTSSDDSAATPSFVAADVDPESTTDAPSSTPSPTDVVSSTSFDASAATPSFVAAEVDPSTTDAPYPTPSADSSVVSSTSSDDSAATSSYVLEDVDTSSTFVPAGASSTDVQPTSTSSGDPGTSTGSALDVQVAVSSSRDDDSQSTDTVAPMPSSSDSSAPTSIVSIVATSSASFSNSAPSPSSSADAVAPPPTSDEQAVWVGSPVPRAEMTAESTAPYHWMFSREDRL